MSPSSLTPDPRGDTSPTMATSVTAAWLAEAEADFRRYVDEHQHEGAFACCAAHKLADITPVLLAEVDRLRAQRSYLIKQIQKKDARSGEGEAALREFLSGSDPAEGETDPSRRLAWRMIREGGYDDA